MYNVHVCSRVCLCKNNMIKGCINYEMIRLKAFTSKQDEVMTDTVCNINCIL